MRYFKDEPLPHFYHNNLSKADKLQIVIDNKNEKQTRENEIRKRRYEKMDPSKKNLHKLKRASNLGNFLKDDDLTEADILRNQLNEMLITSNSLDKVDELENVNIYDIEGDMTMARSEDDHDEFDY